MRHHLEVARIEVREEELTHAFAQREPIVAAAKAAGFKYAALDLEGFQSGSLNRLLPVITP